jgi:pyruvate/2-oxoglutarate dehydrogenase complex dihydrolipoamide dehydrogenase (E3) component
MATAYDVVVIGRRTGRVRRRDPRRQLKFKTAVIERERLGGNLPQLGAASPPRRC